ncbi:unnamed protein product [Trifolium pratense]|uniref:Uncharacterized protein n=1 Tax=Trifolium pratense TaxID=57577 RepID=A0ACB0KFD3_TRIPR|nr:unnamed protein product [Trifolium pratense]
MSGKTAKRMLIVNTIIVYLRMFQNAFVVHVNVVLRDPPLLEDNLGIGFRICILQNYRKLYTMVGFMFIFIFYLPKWLALIMFSLVILNIYYLYN